MNGFRWRVAALLAVVFLGSCRGTPPAIGPAGMQPLSHATMDAWLADALPAELQRYDIRWRYQTQQGKSAGRAAVRYAPPDSVRFDYRAPFGRSGAAMLVADSIIWSTSDDEGEKFISVAPLFWAALAIPRPPPVSARVYGLDDARIRSWRYVTGRDTLTYVITKVPDRAMQVELRQSGRILGRVDVAFADASPEPTESTMRFPTEAALVTFSVQEVEQLNALDPAIWKRP